MSKLLAYCILEGGEEKVLKHFCQLFLCSSSQFVVKKDTKYNKDSSSQVTTKSFTFHYNTYSYLSLSSAEKNFKYLIKMVECKNIMVNLYCWMLFLSWERTTDFAVHLPVTTHLFEEFTHLKTNTDSWNFVIYTWLYTGALKKYKFYYKCLSLQSPNTQREINLTEERFITRKWNSTLILFWSL